MEATAIVSIGLVGCQIFEEVNQLYSYHNDSDWKFSWVENPWGDSFWNEMTGLRGCDVLWQLLTFSSPLCPSGSRGLLCQWSPRARSSSWGSLSPPPAELVDTQTMIRHWKFIQIHQFIKTHQLLAWRLLHVVGVWICVLKSISSRAIIVKDNNFSIFILPALR